MQKKKNKRETFPEKIIRGISTARYKMLLEKSAKGQSVVYYDKGKIIEEKAIDILKRERRGKQRSVR
ncbi:MAG: hypothetical protein ABI840_03655 [bacterium]